MSLEDGKGTEILLYQQRSVLAFAGHKREPLSSAKQLGKINGNVHFKPCIIYSLRLQSIFLSIYSVSMGHGKDDWLSFFSRAEFHNQATTDRDIAVPLGLSYAIGTGFFETNLGCPLKDKINPEKEGFPRNSLETSKEASVNNSLF